MYRGLHPSLPNNVDDLRKAIVYRCRTSGQRELELLLQSFLNIHSSTMQKEELLQFHEQVLMLDNPIIIDYLSGVRTPPDDKYLTMLIEYSKTVNITLDETVFNK
jgi:succinate dehydrogenase flavin-adding protein (antitoxin of CptAB toxin-antitoxin module)